MEKAINIHANLIERCKNEERSAQYELYAKYSKAMYNTALRMTGDHSGAQDVLQDAFVNAFEHIGSYREEASFGSWLKRITINKSLNYIRKEKKDQLSIEGYEQFDVAESASASEEISNITVDDLKKVLAQLPSGFRTVVSMYLFEGYDHKEIAEVMNISESTSKSQYKRGKEKLKLLLQKQEKHGG
ncbi:MAG: RNA polymerase sigma factor [Bacteroidota bacterium]